MSRIFAVIRREYMVRVKKRSFIVLTLLGPILIAGLYSLPILFMSFGAGDQRLAVADLSGVMGDLLRADLARNNHLVSDDPETGKGMGLGLENDRYEFLDVTQPGESVAQARARLNKELGADRFDAYLIMGDDPDAENNFIYGSHSSSALHRIVDRALTRAAINMRSQRQSLGLDAEALADLTRPVRVLPVRVDKSGKEVSSGIGQQLGAAGLAWGMGFIFYITFLVWGTAIMRGVIEEKGSRIMEVLLASITPTQFMVGKVTGIGLVALTQIVVWAACAFFGSIWGVAAVPQLAELTSGINPAMFGWFILLFLLGFAIYALLFAAVGSMCTTDQEAQQAAQPVLLLVVVSFFAMFAVQRAPDSTFAVAASIFPLSSPLVMLLRLGITDPPWWQIMLTVALMVVTILAVAWLAARIFRVGTLMYGKRATLPELWRWVRAA